ncbi:MAG: DMT family transporter [Chloroflexota bacterium]
MPRPDCIGARNDSENMKVYLTLLVGVAAMSFASIFIRLAEAPPLVIAAYRLTIAALVFLPFAPSKWSKTCRQVSRRDVLLLLFASLFLALHFALWISSLKNTSIASSVILVTSNPIFVAIFSYFLWKEKMTRLMIGGMALALGGAVLISYGDFALGGTALLGDALAVLAALVWGIYLVTARHLRARIDFLSFVTFIYAGAAVFLLIAVAIGGYSLFGYSTQTYLMMALVALVPQLIGHSAANFALRFIPATLVAVAILGEPVGATLLGYFILEEAPGLNEIAGGVLVLAGIFAVLKRSPKRG